jgi:signal peptide peptidase SppA
MRDAHLVRALVGTPWSILPEKLTVLSEVLRRHLAGEELSPEEVAARIGAAPAGRPSPKASGNVAILPIWGVLAPHISMVEQSSGGTSTDMLMRVFQRYVQDDSIKAIVLDIDSPGGSCSLLEDFAQTIFQAREKKYIAAVANATAASAAYYLGSQATEFIASPSALVGSIGTLMLHVDASKAWEMAGLAPTVISAGKYKSEVSEYEPLGEEAKNYLQGLVDGYYDQFVAAVARGRGVKASAVRSGFGQGRVLHAQDALDLGMVDRVATFDEVLAKLGTTRSGAPAQASSEAPSTMPGSSSDVRRRRLALQSR